MTDINEKNFKAEVEEAKGLVVIDLYADWCGPCKMIAPHLHELEGEYPNVKFARINVDSEPKLAELFRVSSIPMVAFVKDNVFLDFSVGYVPKENLSELIKEYV